MGPINIGIQPSNNSQRKDGLLLKSLVVSSITRCPRGGASDGFLIPSLLLHFIFYPGKIFHRDRGGDSPTENFVGTEFPVLRIFPCYIIQKN